MGVSIYYDAVRNVRLSDNEQQKIDEVIEKYQTSFPYKEEGENFDVYDFDSDEPETIFSGATKLPNDISKSILAAIHWAKCLTEIRRILPNCEWYFALDDDQIPWSDDVGYCLPGVEQY